MINIILIIIISLSSGIALAQNDVLAGEWSGAMICNGKQVKFDKVFGETDSKGKIEVFLASESSQGRPGYAEACKTYVYDSVHYPYVKLDGSKEVENLRNAKSIKFNDIINFSPGAPPNFSGEPESEGQCTKNFGSKQPRTLILSPRCEKVKNDLLQKISKENLLPAKIARNPLFRGSCSKPFLDKSASDYFPSDLDEVRKLKKLLEETLKENITMERIYDTSGVVRPDSVKLNGSLVRMKLLNGTIMSPSDIFSLAEAATTYYSNLYMNTVDQTLFHSHMKQYISNAPNYFGASSADANLVFKRKKTDATESKVAPVCLSTYGMNSANDSYELVFYGLSKSDCKNLSASKAVYSMIAINGKVSGECLGSDWSVKTLGIDNPFKGGSNSVAWICNGGAALGECRTSP